MKVSVIIPSLYEVDGDYLKLCVESIRATTDWQIIVVTNGSSSKPNLDHIRGVSIHLHTRDQGQCNAANIGAQVASGDYLMVSNADMYYAPGWDKNLIFDYPVFSPNLVEPIDNAGSAPPFIKAWAGNTLKEFDSNLAESVVRETAKKELGVEEPGFNLPFFIKRDFWNFLGGYDVGFDPFGSNSDTDLQTRINEAGVTPMRLRDVLVYHFSNKSGTFDFTDSQKQLAYQFNLDYFKQKHGFDRDELGSDVWYNKNMLPSPEKIKYEQKRYEA